MVILLVSNRGGDVCSAQADAVATVVVCSVIIVGAGVGFVAWAREARAFALSQRRDGGAAAEVVAAVLEMEAAFDGALAALEEAGEASGEASGGGNG